MTEENVRKGTGSSWAGDKSNDACDHKHKQRDSCSSTQSLRMDENAGTSSKALGPTRSFKARQATSAAAREAQPARPQTHIDTLIGQQGKKPVDQTDPRSTTLPHAYGISSRQLEENSARELRGIVSRCRLKQPPTGCSSARGTRYGSKGQDLKFKTSRAKGQEAPTNVLTERSWRSAARHRDDERSPSQCDHEQHDLYIYIYIYICVYRESETNISMIDWQK